MFKFETRKEELLSREKFLRRMGKGVGAIAGLICLSLGIGILGYHFTEHMGWIDSLLNASMIAGGMGPVDPLHTTAGKVFASLYAIFSGLFLIATTGILLAPVFHRILHSFHAA
ncbi:MAG: hypothetical protein JWO78_83 [Micavibrio sp.]|nr:hypothetical protein [Micavibrio sp.]